ncbi:Tryptophanyl-tRNA synthetase [Methylophaga frappieri]|uniref:Tryptophan--tRNA ligase n=1 Tax=Methylophaga frappieri (strain ATCC BAA-2434 / DSM 25690 / JAM7) TaxID=754477 RepID=I1YK53_METFJ|nr:tryptophan--tRNA ligase [Methylophaga frappieri]AFJ03296.1 Tryptophanyl-tRNA synthetase [Methylophaga frappieri]
MDTVAYQSRRIVSGMRPTGKLHLGHYHGVLKNWIKLQHEFDCFFFVADWHALSTHYSDSKVIENNVWEMVTDWLAAGIEPSAASLFLQSKVPEHAELHLLLSMITPLSWLEQLPSYTQEQAKAVDKNLSTYGFLGHPLLQSADILIYRAGQVPVGQDQLDHVSFTRQVANRFNHLYGREPDFEERAEAAIKKMGKKNAKLYETLRKKFLEQGDTEALETARELLKTQQNLALGDSERLFGYLEGGGKVILPEPQALLTDSDSVPGTDGRKMSNSLANIISLRESDDSLAQKIRAMPMNRETSAGCPVCDLLAIYEGDPSQDCQNSSRDDSECKETLIELLSAELAPIRERAEELAGHPEDIRRIIESGSEEAREIAQETLIEVKSAMGISYK